MQRIKRFGLLIFLGVLLGLFFYFKLYEYFTFESLKAHRMDLLRFTDAHLKLALGLFALIYTLSVAVSVPGAWFLTLIAGFLFGPLLGAPTVILSATLGAVFVFIAVKQAFRAWWMKKNRVWLKIMEKGFQEDAFFYLLFLRLVPLFPFWFVNIIPALLGVPLGVFAFATLIGIMPGAFVYVFVGHGLGHVLDVNQALNLKLLEDPMVILPLIGLGVLALVPVIYRRVRSKV